MTPPHPLLEPLCDLHDEIRTQVVAACERASLDELSGIASDTHGDTIYAVDRISESVLVEFFEREVAPRWPLVLVAEGLEDGALTLPRGSDPARARWRVIVDPIDGTRGLMYQKRSAWVLTGVAPNRGEATTLADVELALQTEIPVLKQHECDVLWAAIGSGAHALRLNRFTRESRPLALRPSGETTLDHGFATVARFFPGVRAELAAIDDDLLRELLGPPVAGKAQAFEDQYISTGGQLYELMAGHDRFVADLRPLLERHAGKAGDVLGLCCHPYDLCTELIARECGIVVTDERGDRLRARLAVEPDVAWVGYANAALRQQVEPALRRVLERRGHL